MKLESKNFKKMMKSLKEISNIKDRELTKTLHNGLMSFSKKSYKGSYTIMFLISLFN